MKCCVPFCVNNTEILPDLENVTFHRLPTEAFRHASWVEALGIKKDHNMQKVLFVCSLHFREVDFYTTKGGQRAVQRSGVPKTEQVCIVCLHTGSKLYPLKYYNLDKAYENVTGLSLRCYNIILSPKVCSECGQRLINCNMFREKSLRANNLLMELSSKDDLLRIQNIRAISRKKHKLKSTLTKNVFQPDFYDYTFNFDENSMKTENKNKNIKTEKNIKIESVVCDIDNEDGVKNESMKSVAKEESPRVNDIASDEEFLNDDIDNDVFLKGGIDKMKNSIKANSDKIINNNRDNIERATSDSTYENVKILNKTIELDVQFSNYGYDIDFLNESDVKNVNNGNENDTNVKITIENDDIDMDFLDNDMDMVSDNDVHSDMELAPVKNETKKAKPRVSKKSDVKLDVKVKSKRKAPAQGRYLKRKAPTGDMELFKVTVLTYEEQVFDIQSKKDTPLYKNSTYKCPLCFKGYQYEDAYDTHMEQHTDVSILLYNISGI
ncbi:metacaspase-2 [Bicyclus anynana]|uniref:Metacaspase-2 n=1 Tax=Bicyclus anynana TaxID=110368 RepID=A0ABM3M5U4_BICAN|nr:metacaspase-2 [Bicyclus anynana]